MTGSLQNIAASDHWIIPEYRLHKPSLGLTESVSPRQSTTSHRRMRDIPQ